MEEKSMTRTHEGAINDEDEETNHGREINDEE
jgi:hypothetical protein